MTARWLSYTGGTMNIRSNLGVFLFTFVVALVPPIAAGQAQVAEPGAPGRAAMHDNTYVYVEMGESGLSSFIIDGYDCVSGTACAPGAVYTPGGSGLNIQGCKKTGTTTCSGTCKYCSGPGTGALCKKVEHAQCIVGTTPLMTCGTEVDYTCIWAAAPPAVPAGQPIATDNGCYCGTTPGTPTGRTCEFAQCT
jgi:hypothetical protein